jgi:Aspartyl protease
MPAQVLRILTAAVLATTPIAADQGRIAAELTRTALVVVPVHVNGRGPYLFVVDTGATTTTLDDTVATQLGIRATGGMEIVTSAGTYPAPVGALEELRHDDARVLGIVGQDILRRFTTTIDYARREIELTTSPCAHRQSGVDIGWAEGRPTVGAALFGQGLPRSGRLVLDSGANALVIFAGRPGTGALTSVSTHQGTVIAEILPRVRLEIGGVRRDGPAVLIPPTTSRDETGLLPAASFSRVCIDGPRSRATLEP